MFPFQALLLAGPTASGKTALALKIAAEYQGAIINTDSMQIYRDLSVLTARPTPTEMSQNPHFLFGHVEAGADYSVGHWIEDAKNSLEKVKKKKYFPIFVGGTGFYFKALLYGLADLPPVPQNIRRHVRSMAEHQTTEQLHAQLMAKDPDSAIQLRPSDRQRVLRALEFFEATGLSLHKGEKPQRPPLLDKTRCLCVFLSPNRSDLYENIHKRFDKMILTGALEEVHRLAACHLRIDLPILKAHGMPGLLAWQRGEISLEEAIERGKRDTRRYAKRQSTFVRTQLPCFEWVLVTEAEKYIRSQLGTS